MSEAIAEKISQQQNVSLEEHYEIQCFLYKEARLFDNEGQREWLDDLVDPDIRYELLIQQERARNDRGSGGKVLKAYDDSYEELDFRVKQFESGMQWMMTPIPRLRHFVTNIEAFQCDSESGDYKVYSNGVVYRSRKIYEEDTFVFAREDILRRDDSGNLRLLKRQINFDQRLVRGKNILFFM